MLYALTLLPQTSVSETMHNSSDDKLNGLVSILKCCHTPCMSTPCSVVLNSIALQKDNANQLASWRVKFYNSIKLPPAIPSIDIDYNHFTPIATSISENIKVLKHRSSHAITHYLLTLRPTVINFRGAL